MGDRRGARAGLVAEGRATHALDDRADQAPHARFEREGGLDHRAHRFGDPLGVDEQEVVYLEKLQTLDRLMHDFDGTVPNECILAGMQVLPELWHAIKNILIKVVRGGQFGGKAKDGKLGGLGLRSQPK